MGALRGEHCTPPKFLPPEPLHLTGKPPKYVGSPGVAELGEPLQGLQPRGALGVPSWGGWGSRGAPGLGWSCPPLPGPLWFSSLLS